MNPFLKQVANYLYTNHRTELSDFTLVLPTRRAGIFFTSYLNERISSPMLSPEVITMDELLGSISQLHQADIVTLVLKLQEVYSKVTGHHEPFDEFFFWGEILISDFDDIDRFLLDANDLFRNVADLKDLENQFDYLTEEQKKAIEEFWGNLEKVPHSFNKEKFMGIWVKLATIYHQFKKALIKQDLAYAGMISRDVAERFKEGVPPELKSSKYIFIGFNALNACQRAIFRKLDNLHRAMFFWDFDDFYMKDADNEAGRFLHENMIAFPAPKNFMLEKPLHPKNRKITMVSVPGNITQAQAINIPQVVKSFNITGRYDNTAFVVADENLLIPVISAVGKNFSDINITMGYPFVNTPVYGFLSQLLSLQRNIRKSGPTSLFYHKPVVAILNHQFVVNAQIKSFVAGIYKRNKVYLDAEELNLNPFVRKIFTRQETWNEMLDYFLDILSELAIKFDSTVNDQLKLESEYIFQAFLSVQRLQDTLTGLNVPDFPVKVLMRLLDQGLRRITVPFEGEPLQGLQIMGMPETRCLDFENLVVFSANEGFLPRIVAGHSFVPYHLRKGFGMPTYEDRDAIYAYYFYRLIQRTQKTVFVYNSNTEGTATAEKSRFLYQLMYDSDFEVEELNLSFNFKGNSNEAIKIDVTQAHIDKLLANYQEHKLSPSAINVYLDCKLKFYYKYIAEIQEKDELKEDSDAVVFGNLFHYAIELLYKPLVNKTVEAHTLKLLRADSRRIDEVIRQAMAVKYYQLAPEEANSVQIGGQSILIASHMRDYIHQLIENDIKFAPFKILGLEKEYSTTYDITSDGQEFRLPIGGIIDRLDETEEGLRIIDYKTGRNMKLDFKEWPQLVDRGDKERRKEIFQTLIYSDIVNRTEQYKAIFPAIYKLDDLFDEEFVPNVMYNGEKLSYQRVEQDFINVFSGVLSEMFSLNNTFDQTKESQKCTYCAYNKICRR
ncbi:MAG: PD-(D/E)XK nuclease family protein [Candidatus Saccharibacteria bacterium]